MSYMTTLGMLIALAPAAMAQQATPGVTVENAWARATSRAASTGAAYLTITDHGAPDRLVPVATPIAAVAELHRTSMQNGVAQMRPVDGLAITAERPVTFSPGGYHIMLMQLKHPLHVGDTFPLTLTFEKAGPVQVNVAVKGPGASGTGNGMAMPKAMPTR